MLKKAFKVLIKYITVLIGFIVFLPAAGTMGWKEGSATWLIVYTFIIFLILTALIYNDMKVYANKEKCPEYELKPYPLKGFIIGLVGFSPITVITVIGQFINFHNTRTQYIKHMTINTLMAPFYWIIKLGNEAAVYYVLATMILPIIAMIGYLMGYFRINPGKSIGKLFKA